MRCFYNCYCFTVLLILVVSVFFLNFIVYILAQYQTYQLKFGYNSRTFWNGTVLLQTNFLYAKRDWRQKRERFAKLDNDLMLMVGIQLHILLHLTFCTINNSIGACEEPYFLCTCTLPSVKFQMENVVSTLAYFQIVLLIINLNYSILVETLQREVVVANEPANFIQIAIQVWVCVCYITWWKKSIVCHKRIWSVKKVNWNWSVFSFDKRGTQWRKKRATNWL